MSILWENEIVLLLHLLHRFRKTRLLRGLLGRPPDLQVLKQEVFLLKVFAFGSVLLHEEREAIGKLC